MSEIIEAKSLLAKRLIESQVALLYPTSKVASISEEVARNAYQKTEICIGAIKNWDRDFNTLISWQYATYLYFLSREVWTRQDDVELATKIFLVNKALNAIEIYYEIEMPKYFFLSHTVGLVFAKSTFSDYCVFHQGCTIGRQEEHRPTLEPGVVLYPNSSIIGKCLVRENSVIAPGVNLVNQDTPGNCYVFMGDNGRPIFKHINEYFADRYFHRNSFVRSALSNSA